MTETKKLSIVRLYPREMNIYGDDGNVQILARRLAWSGFASQIVDYNLGDSFPKDVDIIIGGGGQDSGQSKIEHDLQKISNQLHDLANANVPMLMICGLYQLFGNFFETNQGARLKGIALLDVETFAHQQRMVGNIITKSTQFGEIIGYENHSGQTFLGSHVEPLAKVLRGFGNNQDKIYEGARYKNVIGSYLHGPLLAKNPKIADFLLDKALHNKYNLAFNSPKQADALIHRARQIASRRPY